MEGGIGGCEYQPVRCWHRYFLLGQKDLFISLAQRNGTKDDVLFEKNQKVLSSLLAQKKERKKTSTPDQTYPLYGTGLDQVPTMRHFTLR